MTLLDVVPSSSCVRRPKWSDVQRCSSAMFYHGDFQFWHLRACLWQVPTIAAWELGDSLSSSGDRKRILTRERLKHSWHQHHRGVLKSLALVCACLRVWSYFLCVRKSDYVISYIQPPGHPTALGELTYRHKRRTPAVLYFFL